MHPRYPEESNMDHGYRRVSVATDTPPNKSTKEVGNLHKAAYTKLNISTILLI